MKDVRGDLFRGFLKRTQLLETILTENGIPIPEYDDQSVALAVPSGGVSEILRACGGSIPVYAAILSALV